MTLPKDVQDAMSDAGKCAAEIGGFAPWESIRAHLLSQDAEIERRFGIGGELIIARRERDALQSRLATADALLRELLEAKWCTPEYDEAIKRVISHLQGAGDET